MTLVEILATAESAGVELSTDGERLRWKCPGGVPELVKELLAEHKPVLVRYLALRDTPWSQQAEAEHLLAAHRKELARLERVLHRGQFPPVTANLVADGLKIAAGYIRDHALEQARGWDPMELLRDMLAQNLAFARQARQEGVGQ
jgi:hypothetical protein